MDRGFQKKLSISPVSNMEDLKEGDHIVVKGNVANLHPSLKLLYFVDKKGYYFHHGIYIGDNKVVDFGGKNKSDAKPRKVDILQFVSSSCDSTIYRVNDDTGSKSKSALKEILARASEVLEDPSKWPGYNVFWNNCESFANYLKCGKKFTEQGKNALHFSLGFLGVASTVAGVSGFAGSSSSH